VFVITMNHSKYSTEPYNIHLAPIIQDHQFFSRRLAMLTRGRARANTHTHTHTHTLSHKSSCPIAVINPITNRVTGVSAGHGPLSILQSLRSRGEGQVSRGPGPAAARPQSRRLNPALRLFGLTRAFVGAAHPQIVNGPSSWPSWSWSAMTELSEGEGGQRTTKASAVGCSECVGQRW